MPMFQKDQYLTLLTPNDEILEQISFQGTLSTPDLLSLRGMFRRAFPEMPEFRLKILTSGETRRYLDEGERKKMHERQEAERSRMREEIKKRRKEQD